MEIRSSKEGSSVKFTVSGEIDEKGAEELKTRFSGDYSPSHGTVYFDFGGVTHIGSAGLGKLLLFYKRVASDGGNIRIENIPSDIFALMQQLKLETVFTLSRQQTAQR